MHLVTGWPKILVGVVSSKESTQRKVGLFSLCRLFEFGGCLEVTHLDAVIGISFEMYLGNSSPCVLNDFIIALVMSRLFLLSAKDKKVDKYVFFFANKFLNLHIFWDQNQDNDVSI